MKQYSVLSVRFFDAKGDNTTDDTAAIQAAANFLSVGGGKIFFPPGVYRYTSFTLPAGVSIEGAGSYCTALMSTNLSADPTIIMANDNFIRDVQFNSTTALTAGRTVWMQGNNCTIENFEAYNYFLFCDVQGSAGGIVVFPKLINGNISQPAVGAGSGIVSFTNYANALVDGLSVTGTASGTQPNFGIRLVNGDTCLISNTNITRHGNNLVCAPGAGQHVFATQASNSLFDSSNALGNFVFSSVGNVYDALFSNCWFGLATGASDYGANIAPSDNCDGIVFSGCSFPNNAVAGLAATGAKVKNLKVTGGYASGGQNGYVFSACTHFSVIGVRAGNVGNRGACSAYGINIFGASDYYIVTENDVSGNGSGGVADTGSGTHKTVDRNLV